MTSDTERTERSGSVDEGRLPASAWLLLVAMLYATLQQGAFHRGPFLVVAGLLASAAAAQAFGAGHRRVPSLLVPVAALAFGATSVSVLLTDATLRSAAPTFAMTAMVLVTIAVVTGLRPQAVVRVVDGVILCALVAAATAWAGVAFHREPWALLAQGIWRGSSTLTYANAAGALVGIGLLLALGRLGRSTHRLAVLPAYGLTVGLLSTGSRAALLGVAVGVAVLARRTGWHHTARTGIPVLVAGVVGAAALLPSLSEGGPAHPVTAAVGLMVGSGLVVVLSRSDGRGRGKRPGFAALAVVGGIALVVTAGSGFDDLASARFDLGSDDRAAEWRAAADEFTTSPVVGVGPGRLDLSWEADGGTYVAAFTHNEYLELLATHGLVGVVGFAACVVLVARRRSRGPSPDRHGAGAALAALAVHSAFDFLWHVPVVALVGGVLVAAVVRGDAEPTPPDRPSARLQHRELEPQP